MAPNPGVLGSPPKPNIDMSIDLTQDINISKMSIVEGDGETVEINENIDESVKIIQKESPVIHISSDDDFPEVNFDVSNNEKELS